MLPGEWRIDYPGTSFSVGGWDAAANPFRLPSAIGLNGPPTVGDVDVASDDAARPRGDGTVMGADYHGGRAVTLSLSCRGSSEREALELAAKVATAWRADVIRLTPGAYAQLSTYNGGRERAVIGRPRRIVPNDTARKAGLVTIECDFQTIDDRWYDIADTGMALAFVNPPSTGIIFPATTPITTTPVTLTPGAIRVDGELEVDPVVTITGPITNPVVRVAGAWTLKLNMTIPQGVSITADTRPWAQSVTANDGASYAGKLDRFSRLDRMRLAPGNYAVTLSGVDNTGLSSMQLAWRHAYPSL